MALYLSDEDCQAAIDAAAKYPSKQAAAEPLGIARTTLRDRLHTAARRGMIGTSPVLPGFAISKTTTVKDEDGNTVREFIQQKPAAEGKFTVPEGHAIKGVSALVDADGNVVQSWYRTREGDRDPLWVAEVLKGAFADYEPPASPLASPAEADDALLTLIPCNDWHINLQTWQAEVGENWDLKIAERVIGETVVDAIMRTAPAGTAIILGGGDLLHADNNDNRTAKSGNVLQADQRHQKGLETAIRLKVLAIDTALKCNERVIVRILPGNHDEQSSVAVAYFLLAYYRNEPRVAVDVDPSLFFWHRFGKVLLGATHGHSVKIQEMAMIMAHRRPDDWGATRFRYVHGFHVHHKQKFVTEGEGVVTETHQAPIPGDAWHYGSGYLSGRSIQTITYHRDFGEISRVRRAILDAEIAA